MLVAFAVALAGMSLLMPQHSHRPFRHLDKRFLSAGCTHIGRLNLACGAFCGFEGFLRRRFYHTGACMLFHGTRPLKQSISWPSSTKRLNHGRSGGQH